MHLQRPGSTDVADPSRLRTVSPCPEPPIIDAPAAQTINVQVAAVNEELIRYLSKHPNLMYDLSPRKFELLIAEIFADMGYEVELTPQTKDGGRDILAVLNAPHGKILTLVECKRYRPDRKVEVDIVERFMYTIDRKDKASCGVIATTSFFTSGARTVERDHKWRLALKDFHGISDWLAQYGMWARHNAGGLWLPKDFDQTLAHEEHDSAAA